MKIEIEIEIYGLGAFNWSIDGDNIDTGSEEIKRLVRYTLDNISRTFGEKGGGSEEEA